MDIELVHKLYWTGRMFQHHHADSEWSSKSHYEWMIHPFLSVVFHNGTRLWIWGVSASEKAKLIFVRANKTNMESEGKARIVNIRLSSCSGIFFIAHGNYGGGINFFPYMCSPEVIAEQHPHIFNACILLTLVSCYIAVIKTDFHFCRRHIIKASLAALWTAFDFRTLTEQSSQDS